MKIEKRYQIEKIASTDETRPHLCSVYLDTESRSVIATNGHALAVVKVETDKADCPGLIPVDAFKQSRKGRGEPQDILVKDDRVYVGPQSITRPDADTKFPPWRQVVPDRPERNSEDHIRVSFDPFLLANLCKALGVPARTNNGKNANMVTLVFPKARARDGDMLAPIVVEVDDPNASGVLMPCREGQESNQCYHEAAHGLKAV